MARSAWSRFVVGMSSSLSKSDPQAVRHGGLPVRRLQRTVSASPTRLPLLPVTSVPRASPSQRETRGRFFHCEHSPIYRPVDTSGPCCAPCLVSTTSSLRRAGARRSGLAAVPGMSPRERGWARCTPPVRCLYKGNPTTPSSPPGSCSTSSTTRLWRTKETTESPTGLGASRRRVPRLVRAIRPARRRDRTLDAPACSSLTSHALGRALRPERDYDFTYLGLQTLYDRYFIHEDRRRLETPRLFWMRVAMGLALKEDDPHSTGYRILRR